MANIWWCNMLLLGFSPARNDKDHGLSFHPNMFDQTNTKGMQVVLFYLLCQINRQRTKKVSHPTHPTNQQSWLHLRFFSSCRHSNTAGPRPTRNTSTITKRLRSSSSPSWNRKARSRWAPSGFPTSKPTAQGSLSLSPPSSSSSSPLERGRVPTLLATRHSSRLQVL